MTARQYVGLRLSQPGLAEVDAIAEEEAAGTGKGPNRSKTIRLLLSLGTAVYRARKARR